MRLEKSADGKLVPKDASTYKLDTWLAANKPKNNELFKGVKESAIEVKKAEPK